MTFFADSPPDEFSQLPPPRNHMTQRAPDAYEEFNRNQYPRVVAFLIYQGFPHHIADEATQDAMVDAHRNWQKITSNPPMWVRTAAVRHAGRKVKSMRKTTSTADGEPEHGTEDDGLSAVVERHGELAGLVNKLPDRLRTPFALHLDEFSAAEIAEHLGVPERTVYARLERARELLKKDLFGGGNR